jgi:pre-peptidase
MTKWERNGVGGRIYSRWLEWQFAGSKSESPRWNRDGRQLSLEQLERRELLSIQPISSSFAPTDPGNLVYDQFFRDSISSSGEVDRFTVDLPANHVVSLLADGDSALKSKLELLSPGGTSLGTGIAPALSGQAAVGGIQVSQAGTYTIEVSGEGGSQGSYGVRVLLNSTIESESIGLATNDSAASAQTLESVFIEIGGGVAELAAVSGSLPGHSESFESGRLDARWQIFDTPQSRTQITTLRGAADGESALLLGWEYGGDDMDQPQEAIWTVDMAGLNDPVLDFQAAAWYHRTRSFDGPFTGHYNASGVAISADGEHWFPVADVAPGENWTDHSVDLAAEADTAGIGLDGDLQIKFQRWGRPYGDVLDGLAFDAITISTTTDNADWYQFSLDDGQTASIGLVGSSLGMAKVELYDSNLDLLTASVSTSSSRSEITQFYDSTTNSVSDTYYAKVVGLGMEYQLSVLRDANYHSSSDSVQELASDVPVLGGIFWERPSTPGPAEPPTGDSYQFEAVSGDQLQIRTQTPIEKTYFYPGHLDPALRLRGPDGTILAENDNGGTDGWNSVINFDVPLTGTYTVEVATVGYTSGEYLLDLDGATGSRAPFLIDDTVPADGATISDPTTYLVQFSHGLLASSVAASDLKVDGQAATSARFLDGRTVEFTLPTGLAEGVRTVSIAAGAIKDISGRSAPGLTATFRPDVSSPQLLSSTLHEGDVVGLGTQAVEMQFDEPLMASVLDAGDVQLVGLRTGAHEPAHFAYDADTSILDLRYADLEDDAYTLTLTSGAEAFRDPAGHGLDGGDMVIHFSAQAEDAPLSEFEPLGALGNLAYRTQTAGRIADSTDDTYLVDLNSQQTVALWLETESTLRGTVELVRPDGSVLASATAPAAGESVELRGVVTPDAGLYRIAVRGTGNTTGDYELKVLLNAVREDPTLDDEVAENVDSAFRPLPGGSGERLVILGEVHALGESFESDGPSEGWWWTDQHLEGTQSTFTSSEWGAVDGEKALMMQGVHLKSGHEAAGWTVDTSGLTNPTLSFWHASWEGAGEWHPDDQHDISLADGLVIQTVAGEKAFYPGDSLHTVETPKRLVWMPPAQEVGEWVHYTLDLAELAEPYPEPFGPIIKLTFQRGGGQQNLPDAGRGWDAIVLSSSVPVGDWYEMTLEDGQSASVVMTSDGPPTENLVEIYDSQGNLLAKGEPGEDGFSSFSGFRDSTTDGAPDTYRVRAASVVTTPISTYTLTVTRDSEFDIEPNDDTAAQTIDPGLPLPGHISALDGDHDAYQFAVNAGATITASTATPAVGATALANHLDPRLELYGPDGTLIASDDDSGTGSNAAISHVASAGGSYTLRVLPVAASAGDYVLTLDASSPASIPFEVVKLQRGASEESTVPPLEITFNDAVSLETLDASDFLVNGVPVESFEVVDARTVLVHPKVLTSGAWSVTVSAGALENLRGTPVQSFAETLTVSIADAVLPGGLLDETLFEGSVDVGGQVDSWQVRLTTGQMLTALIGADESLPLQVRLLAPNGSQIASGSGAAGEAISVTHVASTAGNYTVLVSAVGSATGSYEGRLIVDALVERETTLGTPNNTLATAENLDDTFIDLGDDSGQRAAARGYLPGEQTILAEEDFSYWQYLDDPALPEGWTSATTRWKFGHVHKTLPTVYVNEFEWESFLVLGSSVRLTTVEIDEHGEENFTSSGHENNIPHYYEANWPVDLSQATGPVTLNFDTYFSYTSYVPTPFSGSFTDRVNASGIAISTDGINWHPAWNMPDQEQRVWKSNSVDLSAAASAAGIAFDSNMWIRLQYYAVASDEFSAPQVRLDNLEISSEQATEDWYRFSLEDGQTTSLMADSESPLQMSLYDSQSNLLAEGVDVINARQVINQFGDTTSNGQPSTYYVRITGAEGPYSLVVSRDAALDSEPNRDFATAQDVTGADGVLGNLGDRTSWAPDSVDPEAQDDIARIVDFAGPEFRGASPGRANIAVGSEVVVSVAEKEEGENGGFFGADLAVYDKASGRELAQHDLATLLRVEAIHDIQYPSVNYDDASGRFFVAFVDYAEHQGDAVITIGVSKNSSPTRLMDWDVYHYNLSRELVGSELSEERSYLSYFELALNGDALWLSGKYSPYSPFVYGEEPYVGIIAIDMQAMLNGAKGAILFERYFAGDHVTPMVQNGPGNAQYFASADAEQGSTLTLHSVSFVGALPNMQTFSLTVPEYDRAEPIYQNDQTWPILSGSARIRTGAWHDGSLWIAHAVADPDDQDDAVVRWYEIETNSFPYGIPTLAQVGDVDPGDGASAFSPAIAVNADGQTGLAYLVAGAGLYPSAYFTGRVPSDPEGEMRTGRVLAEGQNTYWTQDTVNVDNQIQHPFSNQQSLLVDSVDGSSFWMLGEYAADNRAWATQIGAFQIGTPGGEDWYAMEVKSGENIDLESFTPGDTWLAATQKLDVTIELYAPDGTLVMTDDNGAADGRNAKLSHTATEAGRYRIRVVSLNGSKGEYVLGIDGPTATNSAPEVVTVSPPLGVTYGQLPEQITIAFSEPLRPGSIHAGDLQVGGKAALSVEVLSANVLRFEVDPSANGGTGSYAVELAADAVTDIVGLGNRLYQASIDVDARAPQVASLLVNGNAMPATRILDEGKVEFQIRFDEEMFLFPGAIAGPLSPQADGIELVGHMSGQNLSPDSVQYDAASNTITLTYDSLSEDVYTLTLVSGDGTFEDFLGNNLDGNGNGAAGGDYVVDFTVDMATGSGLPLSHQVPFGSLIYRGEQPSAVIHDGNDRDEYTFYAQAGQTISVAASPTDKSATVTVELVGLGASASSAQAGEAADLASYRVASDGVVTLRISASKATYIELDVCLNGAIEVQDSVSTDPMSIDATKIGSDEWQRWAVVGSMNAQDTEDAYSLDLTGWAGQTIDIVVAGDNTVGLSDAELRLFDANGTELAIGSAQPLGNPALNYDLGILDFQVPTDGRYTVRLADSAETSYAIVVTADTPFDTELRNNADSPRRIGPGSSALGYLSPEAPLLFVVDRGFFETQIHTVNAATGKIVNTFDAPASGRSTAPSFSPSYGVNLAFDGMRLYYTVGGPESDQTIYVLDARDGTVLDTFEAVETTKHHKALGLAYLNGELFVVDVQSADVTEIDVYDAETGDYQRSISTPVLLGLGGDAAGGVLYGVNPSTYEIARINPNSGSVVKTMPSGVAAPQGMAVIGDELFVSHTNGTQASQIIVAYDIDTMAERRRIRLPMGSNSLVSGLGGDGILARFIPSGNGATSTVGSSFADFDSHEVHTHDWLFGASDDEQGTSHLCVTSFGPGQYDNGDPDVIPPVTERISPDAADPLELAETENNDSLGLAQSVPLGFGDDSSTAVLVSGNFSDNADVDYYKIQLNAGDIFSVRASGAAASAAIRDYRGETVIGIGNSWMFTHYPPSSPLFADSRFSIAYVAEAPGTYYVEVSGSSVTEEFSGKQGDYFLDLEIFRPQLESQPLGTHQILYLDFDGASLDSSFHSIEETTLSPLVDFLPRWGLDPETDLDPVIDAIIAQVEASLSQGIRASGVNGDYAATGIPGQFDIEILNSRDHGEQFGNPNVSRVIVGGTVDELGIRTIGIAQSIDVGNFETEESAVVLLDFLSASPEVYSKSLNTFPLDPSASMIDLVGAGVGNITAHEAGHIFGNWHTHRDNELYGIMEPGGRMDGIIGIGPDGIFGTDDDQNVQFVYDQYSPYEYFNGFENTAAVVAYGLSTGKGDASHEGPTVVSIDLNAPADDHLNIRTLNVLFSEPVDTTSATLPANYRLIEAGPNGVFENGLGDDRVIGVTPAMDGDEQVVLTIASGDAPLPLGQYELTVLGKGGGVTDLNGDTLGKDTQSPDGRDIGVEFQVAVPAIGDWYQIHVGRGDKVKLWTETPYDHAESSLPNDLDAQLLVISPTQGRILHDLDSADGKNPKLEFTAQESGDYLVRIAATSGQGEYVLQSEIVEGAPSVVSHSPAHTVANSVSSLVITFSHDMDTSSFSLGSDVVTFVGPAGTITPSAFTWKTPRQLEITFPLQTAEGQYEFVLAPTLASTSGFALDQDGDETTGETPDDRYVASFTLETATDFGYVLFDELPNLNPSQGDLVYRVRATNSGFLTVLGGVPATGTLQFELHDEATGTEYASTAIDGSHRIDLPLQADDYAILRVSGTATDVDLRLVNLVERAGTTVNVYGTDEADAFSFDASSGFDISIKGIPYRFAPNELSLLTFDGGLGDDTAAMTGTAGDEEAILHPDHGEFSGNGWKATVASVVSTELIGGGGYDLVQMNDSLGDDRYESAPGLSTLTGPGFTLSAKDFSVSHAYGKTGGKDTAVIHGPEGSRVKFKSDNEGGWSKLYGSGFFSRAKFFEVVEAHSHGENSLARLFDSKGDDTFTGQMQESRMVSADYDVTVHGFTQLIAYCNKRGHDTATLIDSTLNDEVRFRAHKTQMYDLDTRGDVYNLTVRAADEVHAKATEGGYDKAKLHDTIGDDLFEASGNVASLSTMKAQMELLYEAIGFEFVKAYSSEGTDRAKETAPIDFNLAYEGDWE